jgi:hypothetical protein
LGGIGGGVLFAEDFCIDDFVFGVLIFEVSEILVFEDLAFTSYFLDRFKLC